MTTVAHPIDAPLAAPATAPRAHRDEDLVEAEVRGAAGEAAPEVESTDEEDAQAMAELDARDLAESRMRAAKPRRESERHPPTHRRYYDYARLRAARRRAGASLEEAAAGIMDALEDGAGWVSADLVAVWESGVTRPGAAELFALASFYGVSLEAFSDCSDCRLIEYGKRTGKDVAHLVAR